MILQLNGQQLDRNAEHYLGLGTHLSKNLRGNIPLDKIAALSTDDPNSLTSHSTFPHCPKACILLSMTLGTPAFQNQHIFQLQHFKQSKLVVVFVHIHPTLRHNVWGLNLCLGVKKCNPRQRVIYLNS